MTAKKKRRSAEAEAQQPSSPEMTPEMLDEARQLLEAEAEAIQEADERNPVLPGVRANSLGAATILLERFFTVNGTRIIARWKEVWYVRSRGVWEPRIDDDIDQLIQQKLSLCRQVNADGEVEDFNVSCAAQSEIKSQIAKMVNIPSELKLPVELTEHGPVEVDVIGKALSRTQLVDMLTGGAKSTDRMFYLGAPEWDHDTKATAPIWDGFVSQVFEGADEDRNMLAQWAGYVLSSSTRMQKALLIEGPPRAGKGVIGRVITELIGKPFLASPSLQDLSKDFGLQDLLDKKLLLSSDVRLSSRTDIEAVVEKILRITGEDNLSVGRKYTSAVQSELGVRVMLLTNSAPHITDNNKAFFSRFLIIRLNKSFLGNEDPDLFKKMKGEMSGIANWAIAGYKELVKNKKFVESKSSMHAREEWHSNSNPTQRFVDECCELGDFDKCDVEPAELYVNYVRWAKYVEMLRKIEVKDWMMRNLYATLGPMVEKAKSPDGSKRIVRGIKLKDGKVDELAKLERKANAF